MEKSSMTRMPRGNVSAVWAILTVLFTGCGGGVLEPIPQTFGVTGKVYSEEGGIVSDARVYCLFFLYSAPPDLAPSPMLSKDAANLSFPFRLYQTFPNPFSHSLFLRFSLPEDCFTDLTFFSERNGQEVLRQSSYYAAGYYQEYFPRLGSSRGLKNGVYHYRFEAHGAAGVYQDEKSFLLVNDSGVPNARSDAEGAYVFDGQEAFVGDSIAVMNGETLASTRILDGTIQLLVVKEGYQSLTTTVTLVPGTMLVRDIVLRRNP